MGLKLERQLYLQGNVSGQILLICFSTYGKFDLYIYLSLGYTFESMEYILCSDVSIFYAVNTAWL